MSKTDDKSNKVIQGKSGIRNFGYEEVLNGKSKYHYLPDGMSYTQVWNGFFYKKDCLFCNKRFESRRIDTAFCGQACQKAYKRLHKNLGQQAKK